MRPKLTATNAAVLIGLLIAGHVSGCVSWQADWDRSVSAVADTDTAPLLQSVLAWKVYFQRDAREMLAAVDQYF